TQILAWVHRKGADGFARMSNLSRGLRARLDADFTLGRLAPVFVADAADGTRKLLFHLPGEGDARPAAIESVLIPQFEREAGARDRLTLCISSQAGCGMGCGFCATARMGLVRNLSPAEIVGQVRAGRALAARWRARAASASPSSTACWATRTTARRTPAGSCASCTGSAPR